LFYKYNAEEEKETPNGLNAAIGNYIQRSEKHYPFQKSHFSPRFAIRLSQGIDARKMMLDAKYTHIILDARNAVIRGKENIK
jgi:hypothetical protein